MLKEMYAPDMVKCEIVVGVQWMLLYTGDEPVGYFSYSMVNQEECKLHKIYVHPSVQGKGIGRRVFHAVAAYARACGAKKIILNVNRNNKKAISVYERFGLAIEKEEDVAFGPFQLNDYHMEFVLIPDRNGARMVFDCRYTG